MAEKKRFVSSEWLLKRGGWGGGRGDSLKASLIYCRCGRTFVLLFFLSFFSLQLPLLYIPIIYLEYAVIVYLVSSPRCPLTVRSG